MEATRIRDRLRKRLPGVLEKKDPDQIIREVWELFAPLAVKMDLDIKTLDKVQVIVEQSGRLIARRMAGEV